MKKINKKKVIAMLFLLLACIPVFAWLGNSVQAQINPDSGDYGKGFAEKYKELVDSGLNTISINSIFSGLNKVIGMLALTIYLSFSNMFNGITGAVTPTPDNIIFNRVAVLDVNFFNPYEKYSIISMTGDPNIVLKLYNSFSSIALTAFVLCAMIVGIKIVLSSIASEKAAAKNALKSWLVGILLLFLMRLIMAGMFELNEILVYNISKSASEVYFPIKIDDGSGGYFLNGALKWFGVSMGDFIKGAMNILTHTEVTVSSSGDGIYGYNGMLFMYALQACMTGDFLCAIVMFVILGQSITLFIAYAKRLLYIIILGVTAPMVILLDTINKILKGSSSILNSWFKEFTSTVFMQTFHSVLLLVTMNALAALTSWETGVSSLMSGAVAIALTSGMIKFEKVYKKIFGLSDGMVGGLQGQAAKLLVGLNAAKTGIKAVADNGTKLKNAAAQRTKAKNERNQLIHERGRQNAYGALENLSLAAQLQSDPAQRQIYLDKANEMFTNASRDGYKVPDELVKTFKDIASSLQGAAPVVAAASTINFKAQAGLNDRYSDIVNYGARNSSSFSNTSNVYNSSMTSSGGSSITNFAGTAATSDKQLLDTNKNIEKEITKLRKQLSSMDRSTNSAAKTKREIAKADREIRSANAEIVSSAVATAMGPANLAAGIGMGLGFGDSMADVMKGGYVTAALDSAAEHAGRTIGKAVNARFDKHSKTDDIY